MGQKIETYDGAGNLVSSVDDRTLEEAKAQKLAFLSAKFRETRDGGTTVSISGNDVHITTTHAAQQELRELVTKLAGGGTQKGVTRSGAPVVFSEAIAQTCLDAVNDHHADCNTAEYDHTLAIAALTTKAAVDDYNIDTGWPS